MPRAAAVSSTAPVSFAALSSFTRSIITPAVCPAETNQDFPLSWNSRNPAQAEARIPNALTNDLAASPSALTANLRKKTSNPSFKKSSTHYRLSAGSRLETQMGRPAYGRQRRQSARDTVEGQREPSRYVFPARVGSGPMVEIKNGR